jgi:hypothetical protein
MTILMTSELPGADDAAYGHLLDALRDALVASPGFIAHAAGPVDGGYRVTELWESEEAHQRWFEQHVVPVLPEGAPRPTVSVQPIVNVALRDA